MPVFLGFCSCSFAGNGSPRSTYDSTSFRATFCAISIVLTENLVSDHFREVVIRKRARGGPFNETTLLEIIDAFAAMSSVPSGMKTRVPVHLRIYRKKLLGDALVAMVQPTNFGKRDDSTDRLYRTRIR